MSHIDGQTFRHGWSYSSRWQTGVTAALLRAQDVAVFSEDELYAAQQRLDCGGKATALV